MHADDDARRYVKRWFWTLDDLAEAVGAAPGRVEQLIAAKCAPGPIYAKGPDGWWSALGAEGAPPAGKHWYSPGAAWGLRQAELATRGGSSPAEAAVMFARPVRGPVRGGARPSAPCAPRLCRLFLRRCDRS